MADTIQNKQPVRRRFHTGIVLLALVLAVPALAQEGGATLRIQGTSSPSEQHAATYVLLPYDPPTSVDGEGYHPKTTADAGGTLPSEWTRPVKYTWDFGDGTAPVVVRERVSMSHQFKQQGDYTITVTAENEGGVFATGERSVAVRNGKPKVLRIAAHPSPSQDAVMVFSAWAEDTPEDELTYTWDFGDGDQSSGVDLIELTHQYLVGGQYEVKLTVEDADGGSAEETETVRVVDASSDDTTQAGSDEIDPNETVQTAFQADFSGAISGAIDGDIRSLGGVHLQAIRPGLCRFMFTVWDPALLGYGLFVLDMKSLTADGGIYTYSNPSAALVFYPRGEHYELKQRSFNPSGLAGLGGLVARMTGGSEELAGEVGKQMPFIGTKAREPRDLGPPAATSPFGLDDGSANYGWQSGTLEMTFLPGRFARGTINAMFDTKDEDAPNDGAPISVSGGFAIDLEAARRDGIVNYEGCAAEPLEITSRWPKEDAKHFSIRRPPMRVRFNQDIDPESISDTTIQVGYNGPQGQFQAVAGRRLISEETVRFVPDEPLLGGVRYTVRVKTGDDGVRGKSGSKFEEVADPVTTDPEWTGWRFSTKLDFIPESDESELLSCHTFQTARDVPLIVGKPAFARIYANWKQYDQVALDDQTEKFRARVTLPDAAGGELTSVWHEFIRPDAWARHGIRRERMQHTAQLPFTPYEGMGPGPTVSLEVAVGPGEEPRNVYRARCAAEPWTEQPTLTVDTFFLKIGDFADEEQLNQVTPLVRDLVSRARTFAWQNFPVKEIEFSVPRFVDPPIIPQWLPGCGQGCWLEGPGDDERLLNWIWGGLEEWLSAQSNADIIAVVGPHAIFGGGGTAFVRLPQGQARLATSISLEAAYFDRYVHSFVHEIGHTLTLEHIPTVSKPERTRLTALRNGDVPLKFQGIEGLRMSRDGQVAWNKSSEEGNEEGPWLTPLMYPATISTDQNFISRPQYRRIQKFFEDR
jgi:PKD repeat protein